LFVKVNIIYNSYSSRYKVEKFLQMTDNHLLWESVPRVPINFGPSGTDVTNVALHRRDKSPVG